MTPVKVVVQVQKTTVRTMDLTAEQVENVVRRWARREHGFSERVEVESDTSHDGLFRGMSVTDRSVETYDNEDTEVKE